MNKHEYELIIIGAGPAGITAAIYAARKSMDFMVLTMNIGGQVSFSSEIENYTGFQYITGEELTEKFRSHLEKYKFDLFLERAVKVEFEDGIFKVRTEDSDYLGRTVIVATGRRPRKLNVPGEEKLKNRGVTYCVTCDGPLFEGLDVAVIGGGNSGLEAALQLVKIANSVKLIEIAPQLRADKVLIDKLKDSSNVEILTNTKVLEIIGDNVVAGIKVLMGDQKVTLPVQGVFVEIGSTPNSDVVDFVEKNPWGEIIVNCRCETSFSGLFAAGDVTNVPEKQIVVAAGEGCKAALSAFKYLQRLT